MLHPGGLTAKTQMLNFALRDFSETLQYFEHINWEPHISSLGSQKP